jgi:hypothetical protein
VRGEQTWGFEDAWVFIRRHWLRAGEGFNDDGEDWEWVASMRRGGCPNLLVQVNRSDEGMEVHGMLEM